MHYLINPGGRVVEIGDEDTYNKFKNAPGFQVASDALIQDFQDRRIKTIRDQKLAAELDNNQSKGIFFATVSQGGKDGYGVSSNHIVKHLRRMGVNAKTYFDNQQVAILYHNPYSITRLESPYRMLYTMFESDKIPDDWRDYLLSANKVLVPSKWCQSVFAKAGIETTVVPLGYDDETFKYVERKNKREAHEPFVFLHYNAFNIRKGFPEVFKAFNKAFGKNEPVKLVLKTTLDHIPLPITPSEYPNIEIITGSVDDDELARIIKEADAFVFPSRGEGFGMTPLEAMATGLPTIVPNAHGITEYFNPDYMYEAKVSDTCPGLYSRYKGIDVGKMVVCDVDQLAAQMRYIYEHEAEAKEKGKQASEYVKQWTFEKTAQQLKGIVDDVLSRPLPQRPQSNVLSLEKVS